MNFNLSLLETITETAKAKASGQAAWVRAIEKAAEQLMSNPYICEQNGGLLILSYSGETYHANGACQCKAYLNGRPCWHRTAAKLVKRYREAEAAQKAAPAPATEPTASDERSAYDCPNAPMCAPGLCAPDCPTAHTAVIPESDRAQLITDIKAAWHRARPFESIALKLHRLFGVTKLEDVATDDLRQVLAALTSPPRPIITHTTLDACARGKRSLTRFYNVPVRSAHRYHA